MKKIFNSPFLCREFLGQAWMKTDKATRAPHILLMTKRFNEVSQLVVSEIIRRSNMSARVAAIEKWAAVAHISRVLHNYNGVLQICAAFTNTSVYRLKKTWEKVSKTVISLEEFFQNNITPTFVFLYYTNITIKYTYSYIIFKIKFLETFYFVNYL